MEVHPIYLNLYILYIVIWLKLFCAILRGSTIDQLPHLTWHAAWHGHGQVATAGRSHGWRGWWHGRHAPRLRTGIRCHVKRLVTCRQPSTRRLHRARQPRGPIDWPATGGERLQASSSRSLLPAQAKPVAVILDPGRLHFGIQSATIRRVLLPRFLPTVFHHCMILNPHRL